MKSLFESLASAIPERVTQTVSEWCRRNLHLPNSAKSKSYDPNITPWCLEPMNSVERPERRRTTFVKPIQAGGSVIGEGLLCYWLATKSSGDVQYNWQNDEQADARWQKRVERIFKACEPVMRRAPDTTRNAGKWTKGLILFPHCNFTMQGVLTNRNVASDSIKFQINEEVHDEEGWLPGRLQQAIGRTTAHWDHSVVNISNAGKKNSELHEEFLKGTQQPWAVKCPGCGQLHVMRTKWDNKEPLLGGLRYDAEGCRIGDDGYDYTKLASTVRYQMPCGFIVQNQDKVTRRAMSLGGGYAEPLNPGAAEGLASYTLEAVSVDYIDWLDLIMEKHAALKAIKYGNLEPWKKYQRERECFFADDEDRPFFQRITLSDRVKDRAGLPGRIARFGMLDRQQGTLAKGEFPHWWCVIRDVAVTEDGKLHTLLVHEGKSLTDEDAVDVLKRHSVLPQSVACDSGDDTMHVYQFCLKHGFNAIKGGKEVFYAHENGARKIYSPPRPLHTMVNAPPCFNYVTSSAGWVPDPREPMFWFYSKAGVRDRLNFLQHAERVIWETPGDVSRDYQSHMEAEELRENGGRMEWVQVKQRNDLFVCECYGAMLVEMAGLIATLLEEKHGTN